MAGGSAANGHTNGHSNGAAASQSSLPIRPQDAFIPLIIDGEDVKLESTDRHYRLPESHDPTTPPRVTFQGTDEATTKRAIESCQKAFPGWAATGPPQRRSLLNKFAQVIQDNEVEIKALIKEETHCNDFWTFINHSVSIGILEETAAAMTAEATNGQILPSVIPGCYPLVFNEPYGVILGMAPWNAPLILGLRAIVAAVAAGNTVVFKGSEFSPRTHYFIAKMFQQVGFPPGVVNFVLHRPEDAAATYEQIISHPAVKKANFTGSTAVGRILAEKAAHHLKPILLELGGKNFTIVLDDADLERAAAQSLDAAIMNNGQVCMCADTTLVVRPVAGKFGKIMHEILHNTQDKQLHVISSKGRANLTRLVEEAKERGAKVTHASGTSDSGNLYPATLIEDMPDDIMFHTVESFGPLLGIRVVEDEAEAIKLFHQTGYGLAASIFSKNHLRAINLARKLDTGAVHINMGCVHDEGNHPHGGVGLSGNGRFGGIWGLREFVKTKSVLVYPD